MSDTAKHITLQHAVYLAIDSTPRTYQDIAKRAWMLMPDNPTRKRTFKIFRAAISGTISAMFKRGEFQRTAIPVKPGGVPQYHYYRK